MAKKRYDDFSVKYDLAAPCGMYCGHCRQYLDREKGLKKGCEGCRVRNKDCAFIRKDCQPLRNGTIRFCHECGSFPCDKLKAIDSNYKKRYGTSLIINLDRIRKIGADAWLGEQRDAWKCPACGGRMCIHDAKCVDCGAPLQK
jgi:hypothetical protein